MKQLTIKLTTDGELKVTASEPLDIFTTIDLALSTVLAIMNSTIEHTPKQNQEEMKEHLFQTFNIAASALLAQFAPEIELRPDITEEAILNAELDIALNKQKQSINAD